MSSSPEKREHLYKILVIGELGTGKTSFIKRYVHQFFSQNYRATIGVDFALKVLNWDQNTIIRLQLWDIAGNISFKINKFVRISNWDLFLNNLFLGQERFGNMTRVYYKEAVGAFIVFDVTRSATFDAVIKWKQDLDSKVQLPNGSPIPCILIANKVSNLNMQSIQVNIESKYSLIILYLWMLPNPNKNNKIWVESTFNYHEQTNEFNASKWNNFFP